MFSTSSNPIQAIFSTIITISSQKLFFIHLISFQVNFMITGGGRFRSRRQIGNDQQQSQLAPSYVQLYRDLAQTSGGQTIEVTKSELPEAVSIITESSSSSLVLSYALTGNYRLF